MARADLVVSLRQEVDSDSGKHLFSIPRNLAPIHFHAAHARLDVLGAMGAHAGGTLAQMTLPTRIAIALQARPGDPRLIIHGPQLASPDGGPGISIPIADLPASGEADWPDLIARHTPPGAPWAAHLFALWLIRRRAAPNPNAQLPDGLTLLIKSEIPFSAGLAASTALLAAFSCACSAQRGQPLDPYDHAGMIAQALNLVDRPGDFNAHFIDALTCLKSHESGSPRLLRYSARPHRYVGPVPLPSDVRMLAIDTGVRQPSARATLEELQLAGAMGLRIIETVYRDLGQYHTPLHGYLSNVSPLLYRHYFRTLLPKRLRGSDFLRTYPPPAPTSPPTPPPADHPIAALDPANLYRVRTAVDHLIAENEHAEQFLQAMEELADGLIVDDGERLRTLQRAGRLLLASHHSFRLRLEVSCREADWLADRLMESGPDCGVFGARITAAGGGGTVVVLTDRSAQATEVLLNTRKAYHEATGLNLTITEA